jgi:hypothetical protein
MCWTLNHQNIIEMAQRHISLSISDYQFHHLPDAEWFISSYKFVNDLVFLQLPVVYVTVLREVLLRPSDTKHVQDNGLTQQLRSSNNDLKYAVKDSFHNNNQFLVSMFSNEQASLSQSAWHLPNSYLMVPMSAHQKKVPDSSIWRSRRDASCKRNDGLALSEAVAKLALVVHDDAKSGIYVSLSRIDAFAQRCVSRGHDIFAIFLWDPGGRISTGWGQAVFQVVGNVSILPHKICDR